MAEGHPDMRQQAASASGVVVVYQRDKPGGHESAAHAEAAKKLAAILGYRFAGTFDPACDYGGPLYFVPSETLVTAAFAQTLGIRTEQDLFGGVVPYPFVATKTITHPLPADAADAPPGWSHAFSQRVRDVVLPGFSAFSLHDAIAAGARLLEQGPVRLKKASGIGGQGQEVVTNEEELQERLRAYDVEQVLQDGLVLERNLAQVDTQSVGQVRVGELTASYYGTQRLTTNNRGEEVYGGSDLVVVRGDFDTLLQRELPVPVRVAIEQACVYHAAALASFPGMFASRCNYDIAQGMDDDGRWYSGVLEQSWRIGGASGAEIAALDAFRADRALAVVHASTVEVYDAAPILPPDAELYYRGVDAAVGPLTKYAKLNANP